MCIRDRFQSAADFGKYRDDNDARISVMQNRANAYRTYFQDNREIYGEDAVNGVLSTLDQGSKYLEELRGGLNSEYDFWSQFKDENDYNTYQRGKEYAALAEKPDFAEKSQYKSCLLYTSCAAWYEKDRSRAAQAREDVRRR